MPPAVPSVPFPEEHRYRPRGQGHNRANGELHLLQVLHDIVEVIRDYSKAGGERLGSFGVVAGGFVGLWLSPFIVARRGMMRMDRR